MHASATSPFAAGEVDERSATRDGVVVLEIRPRRAGALPAASGPMLEKMSGTVFFCGEMDRRSKAECGHATFVLSLSNTKC